MAIDIIAIDLDDTLLRADLSISEGNKRALAVARDAGIRVVLASGRNVHSMRAYAEELGLLGPGDYMICSNGAEIVHSASGRVLDERRLDPGLCREIAARHRGVGLPLADLRGGHDPRERAQRLGLEDSRLTGQPTILVEDREEFFARGLIKFVVPGEAERIAALLASPQGPLRGPGDRAHIQALLPRSPAPRRRQGLGLGTPRRPCSACPCPPPMAIGDAMNDLGMVMAAG